ncbi:Clp protease N-terminal domain-containing protein [Spirulina major]|uniref:Clp protease N-terminal domain-containing protein n=1 Tax=Spirulina major TaxID=270636 RepID=UPI00093509CE|nr:Clp protease N-terminal domain-containing protein [Spirulina major]
MQHDNVTHYADLLAALGTPARLTIVRLLVKKSPHPLSIEQLQERLKIPASILNQHLNKLRQQGILIIPDPNAATHYTVDVNVLEDLLAFFYAECCVRQRVIDWGRVNDKKERLLTEAEVATVDQESLENVIDTAIYDRLGGKVLQALLLARTEAIRSGHQQIGAEHLLLGLILEGSGLATTVLQQWGLTAFAMRQVITPHLDVTEPPQHIPFSPEASHVLTLALVEANESGDILINTEHILVGLIRALQESQTRNHPLSIASQFLVQLNLDPETMLTTLQDQA